MITIQADKNVNVRYIYFMEYWASKFKKKNLFLISSYILNHCVTLRKSLNFYEIQLCCCCCCFSRYKMLNWVHFNPPVKLLDFIILWNRKYIPNTHCFKYRMKSTLVDSEVLQNILSYNILTFIKVKWVLTIWIINLNVSMSNWTVNSIDVWKRR